MRASSSSPVSRHFLRLAAASGLFLAFSAPPTAHAQTAAARPAASPSIDDEATELFAKGLEAYKQGRFVEAEAAYRAAWALKKGYDIAGSLGETEIHLGRHRDAAEHLTFCVREFPLTGDPDTREHMKELLAQARAAVGALRVTVSIAGAEVRVDGVPIGISPLAGEVFVQPGERVIEARYPGRDAARAVVTAKKGGASEVSLMMVDSDGGERTRSLVPAVVLGGVGVVALGVGIGLAVASGGEHSRADELSSGIRSSGKSCVASAANFDGRCADLADTVASADTLNDIAIGAFAVSALAVAGAGAYLLWPGSDAAVTAKARSVHVAPVVAATGGGLWVSGTF